MSNVSRLQSFIGRTGNVLISGQQGIKFAVRVLDVKRIYSGLQFFCEPIAGSGGKWYSERSVELSESLQRPEEASK